MDEAKADLMMYFVLNGDTVNAESNLSIDRSDSFMEGFNDTSYQEYSSFFEISDFSFNLRLNASEKDGGNVKRDGSLITMAANAAANRFGAAAGAVGAGAAAAGSKNSLKKEPDEYEKWRSATAEQLKIMKFPIEFGTFTFKRTLDSASPIFFQSCANETSFDRAVLVKRLQARKGHEAESKGFMRITFTDVLLTKVSWDDGDIVKESCEFKCKKMDVKYKLQNMDGSLSGIVSQAAWDQLKNGIPPGAAGSQGSP